MQQSIASRHAPARLDRPGGVRLKKGIYGVMRGVCGITGQWGGVRLKKGVYGVM